LPPKYVIFGVLVPLVVALDQWTKKIIRDELDLRERIRVVPGFFDIVHAENPGAAWGMLGDFEHRMPFFSAVALIAFGVIAVFMVRLPASHKTMSTSLALIFAGAAGNFIDRWRFEKVTDFLDFYVGAEPARRWFIEHLGNNHWPVFNVADISISVGVGLYAVYVIFLEPKVAATERPVPPGPSDRTASA